MPSRGSALSTLALIALVHGCSEPGAPTTELVVTDSGTVTVVQVSSLEALSAPSLSPDVVFRTSSTEVELFGVSAARVLDDARVVVGNTGNRELLLLQETGRLDQILGRAGEGPGEFGTISSIHRAAAGGFVVYDARLGRWTRYDAMGEVSSTAPMAPPDRFTDLRPLALGPQGELLAIYGMRRRMPGEGIQRDTTPLLHYEDQQARPDSLGLWAMRETYFERGEQGWGATPVGFGRSLAHFGTDEWAALGDTELLDVTLFAATGEVRMRLRGGGPPIPTETADGEEWRRGMLASIGADVPADIRESIVARASRVPWRETYPAFDDLAVDVEGRVWVGTAVRFGDTQRRWIIFGADGLPFGTLTLPADAEILDIAGIHVITLRRDALDVEELVLWKVPGLARMAGAG